MYASRDSFLQVPVLNIVGALNPFVEETVTLNGKLNPSNTNWMKIQDAAMVVEEQPGKIAEAFRLFMQGQGYCLKSWGYYQFIKSKCVHWHVNTYNT